MLVVLSHGVVATPAAGASTVVSGVVREDTTWTASDGPFVLEGTVVVASEATLTVGPGVRVVGRPGSRLDVRGVLLAEGTESEPVVFTSVTGERDWMGIRLLGTQGASGVDARSKMSRVTVANATAGVVSSYDSPAISDSTFRSNGIGVRYLMPAADVRIGGTRFFRNGVALSGRTATTVTVEDSDFWANRRSLVAGPKRAYDCVPDDGAWVLRRNDLLRGPRQPWHSRDVATAPGSYHSPFIVDARFNHWGTASGTDVEGRLYDDGDNSYSLTDGTRKAIEWDPLSVVPLTLWMPPGEVASPAQEPSHHLDPPTFTRFTRPLQGRCYGAGDVAALTGEGLAPGGTLRSVRVALKRRTATGCAWLADAAAHFEPGSCSRPVWLKAAGLAKWKLELTRSLPAGRYTAMSASNHHGGAFELGRNRIQFTIKP